MTSSGSAAVPFSPGHRARGPRWRQGADVGPAAGGFQRPFERPIVPEVARRSRPRPHCCTPHPAFGAKLSRPVGRGVADHLRCPGATSAEMVVELQLARSPGRPMRTDLKLLSLGGAQPRPPFQAVTARQVAQLEFFVDARASQQGGGFPTAASAFRTVTWSRSMSCSQTFGHRRRSAARWAWRSRSGTVADAGTRRCRWLVLPLLSSGGVTRHHLGESGLAAFASDTKFSRGLGHPAASRHSRKAHKNGHHGRSSLFIHSPRPLGHQDFRCRPRHRRHAPDFSICSSNRAGGCSRSADAAAPTRSTPPVLQHDGHRLVVQGSWRPSRPASLVSDPHRHPGFPFQDALDVVGLSLRLGYSTTRCFLVIGTKAPCTRLGTGAPAR